MVNALGTPPADVLAECRARGILVGALAGKVKHALAHKHGGVDFVIAQGHEAGGHTGEITTMVLVPQVVDAVAPLPVLAAGGIATRAPGRRRDGAGGGRRVVRLGVADHAGVRGRAAAEEETAGRRQRCHGALAGDLGQAGAHAALGLDRCLGVARLPGLPAAAAAGHADAGGAPAHRARQTTRNSRSIPAARPSACATTSATAAP